jgi:transcriptional regulator with XRE-family HTH domain
MHVDLQIGSRLRELRRERGLTIPQLAAATGLTNGFISQLERDLSSASLSSLARICESLGVRIGDVVDRVPAESHDVVTIAGQEHVLLTPGEEKRFHVTESRLAPGAGSGEELHTLPADAELVYVVEGALVLQVGKRKRVIGAGESFAHSPRDPHAWRNPSESDEAVVLWLAVPNPYS